MMVPATYYDLVREAAATAKALEDFKPKWDDPATDKKMAELRAAELCAGRALVRFCIENRAALLGEDF